MALCPKSVALGLLLQYEHLCMNLQFLKPQLGDGVLFHW